MIDQIITASSISISSGGGGGAEAQGSIQDLVKRAHFMLLYVNKRTEKAGVH